MKQLTISNVSAYLCLLYQCTQSTAPDAQKILETGALELGGRWHSFKKHSGHRDANSKMASTRLSARALNCTYILPSVEQTPKLRHFKVLQKKLPRFPSVHGSFL